MRDLTLEGLRILVAEDEYILADDLRLCLEDLGAVVIGPAPSVAEAMALMTREKALDGAVLDVNLGGERIYPVADALLARDVKLVFTTGYERGAIPERYAAIPCCEKPVNMGALLRALGRAAPGRAAAG